MSKYSIAIIGGGFSGVALATQLAKQGLENALLYVIEARSEFGRGIAYGTQSFSHLLNVRAKAMSMFPDQPRHFENWLEDTAPGIFSGESFAPRLLYGDYISDTFQKAAEEAPESLSIRQVNGVATSVKKLDGIAKVILADGRVIDTHHVVLATGHFPPGHPSGLPEEIYGHPAYCSNPWASDALSDIRSHSKVLLIGTGLTAIDLTLSIVEQAPGAEITLVSPRGEFPQVHTDTASSPYSFGEEPLPSTARELTRFLRSHIRKAQENGAEWHVVFDALRPHTIGLWKAFSESDRRRFLEHIRPFFERYRHRMSSDISRRINELSENERITVLSGTLKTAADEDGSLHAELNLSDQKVKALTCTRLINCTGPLCDYRRMQHPLVKGLLDAGYMRPDALKLGIDATEDGKVIDAEGHASDWFSTLGPTLKGTLWETTAVPEIRLQAKALAQRLKR